MKASVIVPSRGGAERLPRLLDALSRQTYESWEAVIVLDGDIDGSASVVERYSHLPVQVLVFPENRGRVAALNAGFAAADGDVLIRADDDFEPSPTHIAAHVEPHRRGVCGVIGLPLNIAPNNAYMRAYGTVADERGRQDAYGTAPEDRWRLWGGNTSVRREIFEEVGEFDPRYVGYGWEDLDLGYRLRRHGIPLLLVPGAEVRHHMAAVTTTARARRAFRSGQGRRRFEHIHGRGSSSSPHSSPATVWNTAVSGLGRMLTYDRTEHLASTIDRMLPLLPRPAARKAIALIVESAARAGFVSGEETSHHV
ncbi:glycosyltransferase family 2 protein [Dermacoccus nishinomiyaensis]